MSPMRFAIVFFVAMLAARFSFAAEKPNIVYILADDLGYGDVNCFNKDAKVKTPNADKLAGQGMSFTDAHSASAVCTPTRYGILTGRYPWRTHLKAGVLNGFSPHLIEPGRMTVASLLKQDGYSTAAFGKWHLGMDWARAAGATRPADADFSKNIADTPTSVGFDTFYGISASLDMPPFIWIENDHTVGVPTTTKKWIRSGPAAADFEAVNVLPTVTKKAVEYIASQNASKPFFLYLPFPSPHTPIVPDADFKGKSGISDYLDYVMETDWALGQVLDQLDKSGLSENTLVIFTSDNGCSPAADFPFLLAHGHDPSAGFRGYKADIFEGGHHIPFIARWPGHIKPAASNSDIICLNDLMATAAEITGQKLPDNAGEDSVSILPDLLGKAAGPVREAIVHASIDGSLSLRQGNWKLELCPGSGGWSFPRYPKDYAGLPETQLYDMSKDSVEKVNVQADHPEIVAKLTALLQSYIDRGRSTPGPSENNDTPTTIRPKQSGKVITE